MLAVALALSLPTERAGNPCAVFRCVRPTLQGTADAGSGDTFVVEVMMLTVGLDQNEVLQSVISLKAVQVVDVVPSGNRTVCLFPDDSMLERPRPDARSSLDADVALRSRTPCAYWGCHAPSIAEMQRD
jgi:hypothetical protein